MYKSIFVVLVFGLINNAVLACDLCTIYLGIQPNDYKNSIAVRHRYRLFENEYINSPLDINYSGQRIIKGKHNSKHGSEPTGVIGNGEKYTYAESYNSYEIITNFYLGKKFQLGTNISFSDNYVYQNDSIIDNIGGIGDLNFILKYQVHNSVKTADTTVSKKPIHRVNIGGGITLPTGNYNKYSIVGIETEFKPNTIIGTPIQELDPHLQAGTGSFSYLLLVEYMLRINGFGFNSNISYSLNTRNKNDFRFSNRFNTNGSFFTLIKATEKLRIMPSMGLSYEFSDNDTQSQDQVIDSGGEVLFLNYGLNLYYNKLGISAGYYQPVVEYLYGDQPSNKRRIISQLTYYF